MSIEGQRKYRNVHLESDIIVEAIEELQQQVAELKANVLEINQKNEEQDNEINSLLPAKDHVMVGSFHGDIAEPKSIKWLHVDNISGNDSNDGSSFDKAFQTVDKAIEWANVHGRHDLRLALVESPIEYFITSATIASQCFHCFGYMRSTHSQVANQEIDWIAENKPVKLRFANVLRPTAFYTTHNNFSGLVIYKSNVTEVGFNTQVYSDGTFTLFEKCAVSTSYLQNGGSLHVKGCVFAQILAYNANIRITGDLTFTASQGSRTDIPYKFFINGGVANNEGIITFRNTTFSDIFLRISNALFVSKNNSFNVGTTSADKTFVSDNSLLVIGAVDRAKFVANSQTISLGDSITFTGASIASSGTGEVTQWTDAGSIAYSE